MKFIHKIELVVDEDKNVITGKVSVFNNNVVIQKHTLKQVVFDVERGACPCYTCTELVGFINNLKEKINGGNV